MLFRSGLEKAGYIKKCGEQYVFFDVPFREITSLRHHLELSEECDVTRSVSKMTEIERRGGKRWDKPKKAEKSRDCGGGKF